MFVTTYRLPSGTSASTQCYARDRAHLDEVMSLRRMDESASPDGGGGLPRPDMASDLLARGKIAAANHALTWTSMVAVRAGVIDGWRLVNDEGLLHRVAHVLESRATARCDCYDCANQLLRLARDVEGFERSVPGAHPCWADGDTRPIRSEYESGVRDLRGVGGSVFAQLVANATRSLARLSFEEDLQAGPPLFMGFDLASLEVELADPTKAVADPKS